MTTSQIGEPKVYALARNIRELNGLQIVAHREMYADQDISTPLVVIAVDSRDARIGIWRYISRYCVPPVEFIVDASSGMSTIRVEAFTPDEGSRYLEGFSQEPAEIPCSGRSVAYNSFVVAGIVGAMLKCYSLMQPYPDLVEIDMATWYREFSVDYDKYLEERERIGER